jgi:hypothetical protein
VFEAIFFNLTALAMRKKYAAMIAEAEHGNQAQAKIK